MSLLGTEARDEYLQIELAKAAYILVTQVRPLEPGQQVLITADTASDARAVRAAAGAVYAVGGGNSRLVSHPARTDAGASDTSQQSRAERARLV